MLNQERQWSAVVIASELVPPIEVDPVSVTPGVIGFVVTFTVALAALALIMDMVRRVRRVRYRQEIGERLDREVAAGQTGADDSFDASTGSVSSDSSTAEDSAR